MAKGMSWRCGGPKQSEVCEGHHVHFPEQAWLDVRRRSTA